MNEQIKEYLSSRDDILKPILAQIPWTNTTSTQNVFHDLMSCIIEQQIHYRSTKKRFEKLLSIASLEVLTIDDFDTFERIALPTIKLSTRKYETIANAIGFFQNSEPDWQSMEDGQVRKILSEIKGIGPWTIDMILMYTLERPDVFPIGDYHLKGIIANLYEMDTSRSVTSEMRRIGANWSPYASIAVKYLLAWKKSTKSRL